MSRRIRTYTVRSIKITIRLDTRTDVGRSIDITCSDEKTHMGHLIRTYTVRTIEIIIILSSRKDVGKNINCTYSDEKTLMCIT